MYNAEQVAIIRNVLGIEVTKPDYICSDDEKRAIYISSTINHVLPTVIRGVELLLHGSKFVDESEGEFQNKSYFEPPEDSNHTPEEYAWTREIYVQTYMWIDKLFTDLGFKTVFTNNETELSIVVGLPC